MKELEGIKAIRDERSLVKNLKALLEESGYSNLRKIFAHVNLATKKFHDIWSEWWKSEVPPRLEVDMIPVFNVDEPGRVLIAGVEVEFFRDKGKSFCDGLQQTLSFGLFGFDSLVLWHIFSEEMENRDIEEYVRSTREIIEGLNLPIVYLATKLVEKDKFEFFAPWKFYSSMNIEANYLLESLRKSCSEKRNPLLYREEVERRKKMLKVILKIPV
jgi:hypothetical protein